MIQGEELIMAGLHLLAHPDDQAVCVKREAQASVVRDFVRAQFADKPLQPSPTARHVIMLGDLNDYDGVMEDAAWDEPISTYVHQRLSNAAVGVGG